MVGHDLATDGVVLVRVGQRALDVVLERDEDVVGEQVHVRTAGRGGEQGHVAHVLDLDRHHDLMAHGLRVERAAVPLGPRDLAGRDRGAHGAVRRVGAAVGRRRRSEDPLGALDREGPGLGVEQQERGHVGAQERAAPREDALHRLPVGQGRVHLASEHGDIHQLPVERLGAHEVVHDGLRDPLLVLGRREHGDERLDEASELPDLVPVVRVALLVVPSEPPSGAPDEAFDRAVHPEVEGQHGHREQGETDDRGLPDGADSDDVDQERQGSGERHGHHGGGLELEAHAASVGEALASHLLGSSCRVNLDPWAGRVVIHGIGRCLESMIEDVRRRGRGGRRPVRRRPAVSP